MLVTDEHHAQEQEDNGITCWAEIKNAGLYSSYLITRTPCANCPQHSCEKVPQPITLLHILILWTQENNEFWTKQQQIFPKLTLSLTFLFSNSILLATNKTALNFEKEDTLLKKKMCNSYCSCRKTSRRDVKQCNEQILCVFDCASLT